MKILKEFEKFIMRGNVVDLAMAVIIGGMFGKIVTSLVADIITPPIGFLLNGINLKSLKWILQAATTDGVNPIPEIAIGYGNFLQASIEFFCVAVVVFLAVKMMNRLRPKEEKPAPPKLISDEAVLLGEIRDLLKQK